MHRDPSIHIRLSDFNKIIRTLGYVGVVGEDVFREAVKYKITGRHVVTGKAKTVKKASRIVAAAGIPIELFEGMLNTERLGASHKNAKPVRPSSPEYITLKEVAQLATDFTQHYGIQPPEHGYRTFIRLGLKLMGRKYSLNRFKTYNTRICEKYEAYYAIESDTDKEGTDAFHQHWQAAMIKYAGLEESLSSDPEKYVAMFYGRLDADDSDAYYDDWIAAQFEELAFLNAIPNPNQFFGENAKLRYDRYFQKMTVKKRKSGGYKYRDADTRDKIDKFKQDRAG